MFVDCDVGSFFVGVIVVGETWLIGGNTWWLSGECWWVVVVVVRGCLWVVWASPKGVSGLGRFSGSPRERQVATTSLGVVEAVVGVVVVGFPGFRACVKGFKGRERQ